MPNLSSVTVANEFIKLGIKNNKPVNQMDIYKLSYFAHGLSLAMYNEPLITDTEPFEAWNFGAILADLYHNHLKNRRADDITDTLVDNVQPTTTLNKEESDIIDAVYNGMSLYISQHLSNKTRTRGGAWDKARRERYGINIIKNPDIKEEWLLNTNGSREERIRQFNEYSDNRENRY